MLKFENFGAWPVKVESDEGYLLVQRLKGVACYPPMALNSTSNS
jgi:hypothetical protein